MNIVPKLNLNKHPKDCDNLSLVDAKNMIVDRDSLLLTTENSIIVRDDINEQIRNLINTDYKIIYAIPCNKEIVFFCLYKSDKIKLIRYNEDLNLCQESAEIDYHGGKFTSTFTYNKNELIISFSEFDYMNNINIPLKVINIGNFNKGNIKYNTEFHSICTEVTIPNCTHTYINGNARKGWYYIFVRYKISDNNYTQWFNIGKSILVDNYSTELFENYFTSIHTFGNYHPNPRIRRETVKADISDDTDFANLSFNLLFNNLDKRYISYQIGFIIVRKDTTKCCRSNDINIDKSTYLFDRGNVIEDNVIDLITSYNNYYNVKTIDSYNNLLYIANYNEYDKNVNVKDITVNIQGYNYKNNDTDINSRIVDRNDRVKYVNCSLPKNTIYDNDVKYYNVPYRVKNGKNVITMVSFLYGHITYNFPGPAQYYYDRELQRLPYGSYPYIVSDDLVVISYNNTSYEAYAKDIKYIFEFNDYNKINSYYEITTTSGNTYEIRDLKNFTEFNNNIQIISVNGRLWWSSGNINVRDVFVFAMHLFNIVEYDFDYVDTASSDLLNSNCVMPDEYYNLFIHFVNKYGEVTNGFHINDFNNIIHNDNVSLVNNNIGNKLVHTNKYCISLTLKINKLPNNYIGYFVSYEKFEPHIKHKGFLWGYRFISNDLNIKLGESLDFNFNQVRLIESNKDVDIIDKTLYIADNYNNIGLPTNISLNINTTGISNNTIQKAYLINSNIGSLYINENKQLIQCSKVCYDTDYVNLEINNAFYSKVSYFKHSTHQKYYNGYNGYVETDVYYEKIFFDGAVKVYRPNGAGGYVFNVYQYDSYNDYLTVPTETYQFLNKPQIIVFPIVFSENQGSEGFEIGCITEMKNTIDLFQQKTPAVYNLCPKIYINYKKEDGNEITFNKTIRRSNIIIDESSHIGWRFFEADNYKNIIENKGNIIKLTSVGNIMLVHTEHSVFQFKTDQVLKTLDETDVAIGNNDIWDLQYQEIFTSELGYAGINDINHAIIGQFGYVFYEQDKGRIFRYDSDAIKQIDIDINNYIRKLKDKYRNLYIVDDINNMRLLFNFYQDNIKETLSYNYKVNAFISRHDYNDTFGYTTKNKIYLLDNITQADIKTYSDTEFNHYNSINESYLSIIINSDYPMIKMLEYIKYKFNKIINTDDILPCGKRDAYYSGELIQILADECDTGEMNIYIDNPIQVINRVQEFNKPYRELGTWNFNYIRDISKGVPNSWPVKGSDALPRFYGNWFIVKFTFTPNTINNNCVEIESLDYNYSKNLT